MVFLDLPSQPTIVLNTWAAAAELMEKRSSNYSDKPVVIMDELCVCVVLPDIRALTCSLASTGWDFAIGVMPYGTRWRETRRTFHRFFHRMAVQKYRHVEEREVRAFLRRAVSFTKGIDMLSVSM